MGLCILVQMPVSFVVNFVLSAPLFGSPGFLVAAAPHARQIAVSVVLGIGLGALLPAIAIAAFPVLRRCAEPLAIGLLLLTGVTFAAALVEQMNVMGMVSLSQAYTAASDPAPFQALRGVVAASRNWAHFFTLMLSGCSYFLLYASTFRFALLPRALAALGMAACLLQICTVAMPLFGQPIVFPLLAPMGLAQLIIALWLVVRGFGTADAVAFGDLRPAAA
jgi:hypothetical protein